MLILFWYNKYIKGVFLIKSKINNPSLSSDFEKVVWCINLAQSVSGDRVSEKTVLKSIKDFNVQISEEEIENLVKITK